MPPLLGKLLADYADTGRPPGYLLKSRDMQYEPEIAGRVLSVVTQFDGAIFN